MNAMEVNNLTKVFGKFTAVDNINFNVKQGEIFGFLGANGAGKSTTIRMLIGILEPTSGDALVSGYSIKNQSDLVKKNIGYMSQKFSLYNDLTVVENIRFFAGIYGLDGKKYEERKKWVLKVADLENMENVITGSLPGGIKQRLALGTAVIHEPKIVFLDEPTSGVDPISRRNFWDLINELSEGGTTVLVTTHYLDEAEFCNDIILINAGKLIAQGNSKELKTNYIKNPILEIESDRIVDSMEILEKEKWVGETSIFGNYIHVILNDSTINENHIYEILREKNGISVKRVEKITPTLEDVFIHLIEKDSKKNVQ
ncbi:MAG: multidrug ABC transporter ATP-binding protein [Stygiobacter sp. RIFOXYA12_FULL_38_9]|nr:MAG: multidrug ABC transporter ATP-binding protein [Stygiobacter sp. GWC2_38_9]OGU77372.1 MAG: multidrug ABC transporter ATP-binding protein [Stygiobacter sp. RIFOXYA12_FULL_38_9]OGV09293.1 MAG: multidrug ABC transporter ATP-binding protein [Stygiobacter sp. RIFOXYB2_FULL_37_11]OGV11727.1 MAG: multidrug ABC transporter ATP-binding protein [Stygiobacter sp. RIFOXYA2_FULL_38_8]OGV16540.1 MAG: multidrug ABC transporter ATP-binding protein [Stygiobacter sp. RIFOXYC2_FULL_38_25]OGV79878.1 MAG: m